MNTKVIPPLFILTAIITITVLLNFSVKNDHRRERSLSQSSLAKKMDKRKANKQHNKLKNTQLDASVIMSDPAMSQKWGLRQIDIERALRISQGSKDIVVAVIDTGIDVTHPDLKNNLWVNKNETGKDSFGRDRASNGIGDDGNGCVDDVYGCNFITRKGTMADLKDNHGHGTHISGIIAAEGGNGIGITGVAPKVRIMTLKYFDPKAKGANNLLNTVRAIEYAVWMKQNYKDKKGNLLIKKMIINYSGGGTEHSPDEKRAVEKAQKAGILFVAAAGNEHSNSDTNKYYPASYGLDNIISVTAVKRFESSKKCKVSSSNYGVRTVDIAAPGEQIYSTLPNGRYGSMTGTSQATAFATGVAALIMSRYKDFDATQVKKYILKTGDHKDCLKNLTGTSTSLNSYRALVTLDQDVNAMGSLAINTGNMSPTQFTAFHPVKKVSAQTRKIAQFGKSLMLVLKQNKIKRRKH